MWFFFDVVITNSYILARNYSYLNVKCVKDYCLQLIKELIGQYSSRKRKGKKSAFVSNKKFKRSHFPAIGDGKQYHCYHCSWYKHLWKDTKWKCEDCNVDLCHNGKDDDCFLQYHTNYIKSEYWDLFLHHIHFMQYITITITLFYHNTQSHDISVYKKLSNKLFR